MWNVAVSAIVAAKGEMGYLCLSQRLNKQPPDTQVPPEEFVRSLLGRLSSGQPDLAWAEFLKRYSPLIMLVTRQFASDAERASDCFLFACEHLSDNEFRRLRSFRPDGPARFQTWLKVVVANLCIDWRRKLHGRARPIAAVSSLPPLEQQVYRHIYLRGMTRVECQRALAGQFPDVTFDQIAAANADLFKRLSSAQRWQLSHRARGSVSLDEVIPSEDGIAAIQLEDTGAGPDRIAEQWTSRELLDAALLKLTPRQRLLLRLRYQQDLTLEEVSHLVGLPDLYRANREIQAALGALAEHLPKEEP